MPDVFAVDRPVVMSIAPYIRSVMGATTTPRWTQRGLSVPVNAMPRLPQWVRFSCSIDTAVVLVCLMSDLVDFEGAYSSIPLDVRPELPTTFTRLLEVASMARMASGPGVSPSTRNRLGEQLDTLRDNLRLYYGSLVAGRDLYEVGGTGVQEGMNYGGVLGEVLTMALVPITASQLQGQRVVCDFLGRTMTVALACSRCEYRMSIPTSILTSTDPPLAMMVSLDGETMLEQLISQRLTMAQDSYLPADKRARACTLFCDAHGRTTACDEPLVEVTLLVDRDSHAPFFWIEIEANNSNFQEADDTIPDELTFDGNRSVKFRLVGVAYRYLYEGTDPHYSAEIRWGPTHIGVWDGLTDPVFMWKPAQSRRNEPVQWAFRSPGAVLEEEQRAVVGLVYLRTTRYDC